MRVHLKLLLPTLPEAVGGKELDVEFAGDSVGELIDHLLATYGRKARRALLDDGGRLDPLVQALLNGEIWVTQENLDTPLHEGDELVLMVMLGGG